MNFQKITEILAFGVLLIGSMILGFMRLPIEMGLAIGAGAVGLAFLNLERIVSIKGAGIELKTRYLIQALIDKETEPQQFESEELPIQDINIIVQKVLDALGGKFTWRTMKGIAKEKKLSMKEVLESLDWLVEKGLVKKSIEKDRWSLTLEGRRLLYSLENP
jgi:predicted transcriptional regulator